MTIDRRNFFRTMGVAGLTLTGIDALASAPEKTDEVEFRGVLFDATRCVGCRTCEMECAKAHGFPEPTEEMVAGVTRKTSETQRCVVNAFTTEKGEIYVRNQCMHCNEPACAAACLTQAMYKTKEGPVIWRADKCMGCRYCMVSCPFDVPKFEYHSANPKIVKCDMCYDRQKEGKLPVCVENCPAEAVFFGTRRELIAEARKRIAGDPDAYIHEIYGESEAGGTSNLYVTPTQFSELGLNTKIQKDSYPALTKGFLYSVPAVFVLLPSLLLGIHEATKKNNPPKSDDND